VAQVVEETGEVMQPQEQPQLLGQLILVVAVAVEVPTSI
jgi:hypothetical protein